MLPNHQYDEVDDRMYTRASEMTRTEVAERAPLWNDDRLDRVYEETPSCYYGIVEDIYEPAEIDTLLEDGDVFAATDTAAIGEEKRP